MVAAVESPTTSRGYSDLFARIDNLQGKERLGFTKTLTLDEKKSYIKHVREKDTEMVTGVFRCFEPVGGFLEMTCAAFEGESPVKYTFYDGLQYTVPKYVARRFESEFQGIGTWYPTHAYIMDAQGRPIPGVGKKNRRFGFSGMEFQ